MKIRLSNKVWYTQLRVLLELLSGALLICIVFLPLSVRPSRINCCTHLHKREHWSELVACLPANKNSVPLLLFAGHANIFMKFPSTLHWLCRTSLSSNILPSHKQSIPNLPGYRKYCSFASSNIFCSTMFLSCYNPVVMSRFPCNFSVRHCIFFYQSLLSLERTFFPCILRKKTVDKPLW